MFHEGFLRAVADDAELHAQLAAHAAGRHAHAMHTHTHTHTHMHMPCTCT